MLVFWQYGWVESLSHVKRSLASKQKAVADLAVLDVLRLFC